MTGIQFDPILHRYAFNGKAVPSVTQILKATGISPRFGGVPPELLERKRLLGIALHRALHFLQEGDLDPASIDPELQPYLAAHQLFLKDRAFKTEKIELLLCPSLRGLPYGMRADVTGVMENMPWLIDWKTTEGSPVESWPIQTAAYEVGLPRPLTPPYYYRRATLQLLSNGEYKFKEWADPGDVEEFKAALFLTWRRINRGCEPWSGNS